MSETTTQQTPDVKDVQAKTKPYMVRNKVHLAQVKTYLPLLTGEGIEDPIADTWIGEVLGDDVKVAEMVREGRFPKAGLDRAKEEFAKVENLPPSHLWLKGIAATALALKDLRTEAELEAEATEQDNENPAESEEKGE